MATLEETLQELLDEHVRLRSLADGVRDTFALAEEVDAKPLLVIRLGTLSAALASHNQHVASSLADLVREADAWGAERLARMDEQHRSSQDCLREAMRAAAAASRFVDASRAVQLALDALAVCLSEEEREYLDADVLGENVLIVDQTDG